MDQDTPSIQSVLTAAHGIGRETTGGAADRYLTAKQVKRRLGKNFMTPETLQYRRLAGGSLIVEISYGRFMKKPMFGLTVFCVGELRADADEWDHALSGGFDSEEALLGRLAQLEAGGRERLAALAAANK